MTDKTKLTKKERKELKKQEKLEAKSQQKKKYSMKQYINWGIGALVVMGIFLFIKTAMTPTKTGGDIASITEISADDWVKGASESATLVIEYSDFQCPACAGYYPLVEKLLDEHGDSVQFVYRQFPLAQHKNSRNAAYASEASGKQGKFWEMQDLLFTRQKDWSEKRNASEIFEAYAEELGLDMEKYKADTKSDEVKQKVDANYASGIAAKIQSTPTFFVNGKKITNPKSYDDFAKLILSAPPMQTNTP